MNQGSREPVCLLLVLQKSEKLQNMRLFVEQMRDIFVILQAKRAYE